ncbi:hypothetical protein ACFVTX_13420 [Agromyces sp. NPDC058136]|uniref:hypothetical protein n=1 Tax=Agromyces sp. NPDC058136 TaxID=3346354 RepID=UPI0036D979E0
MHASTREIAVAATPAELLNQWGSGPLLIFIIVAGAFIAMGALRALERRAKRRSESLPLPSTPARRASRRPSTPAKPAVPLEELERRAGLALVASDERVTAATADVDYARAIDGDDVAEALAANLEGARRQLADAFAVQREAGYATVDDEARRSAYERILRSTGEVDSSIEGARTSLERLRSLGARAAQEAPALAAELDVQERAAASASAKLDDARRRYATDALEPAVAALGEARAALARARAQLAAIAPAVDGPATATGLRIESARTALHSASGSISAVESHCAGLAAQDLAVAEGIAALERDVEHARSIGSSRLATAADEFAAEALALRSALAAVPRDPAELGRRVVRADAAIDAEIRSSAVAARAVEQAVAERSSALAGARMLVSTATNSLIAEPGGDAARIRRDEATKLLAEARMALAEASRSDLPPADARDKADAAAHLARRAMAIARDGIADTPAADGRMFGLASGGDGRISEFVAGLLDRASLAMDDAITAADVDGPAGTPRPNFDGGLRPERNGSSWTWESGAP